MIEYPLSGQAPVDHSEFARGYEFGRLHALLQERESMFSERVLFLTRERVEWLAATCDRSVEWAETANGLEATFSG